MSENEECTHDCSSCEQNCESRIEKDKLNELSKVNNVIAIVSGKGGVGKSLVTSMLAVNFARHNHRTAILDADVTGPSIPKMFGISNERADSDGQHIYPVYTKTGIQVMSINLLLENETDPVVWRGPVIAGAVKQFWTDAVWSDVDYMFVDMPPGTGDVPLTVFQSLPVKGIVVVTSPQDLVGMVVEKAVNMAHMMNVPVLGLVENMSYFECPKCHEKVEIFGESKVDAASRKLNIANIARIPVNPELAKVCDKGLVELYEGDWLDNLADSIERAK